MTEDTVAKPLIKDRFWILSKEGKSVGMLNKLGEMFVVTENGHKSAFENKKNLLKNTLYDLLNLVRKILATRKWKAMYTIIQLILKADTIQYLT